jgi:hypothetical protein
MPSEVYRATDATLVMGVDDTSSPEGQSADALVSECLTAYAGNFKTHSVL